MPKVTEARRLAVRDRIRDAALSEFMDKGLATTSMADIVSASGMSAGAIYGHFTNKAELTAEVARGVIASRVDIVADSAVAEQIPTPSALLRTLFDTMPQDVLDSGIVLQIWGAAGPSGELRPIAQQAFSTMRSVFTDYLAAWLVSQGHSRRAALARARKLAPAFIGLAQGYLVHRSVLGRDLADTYLDSVQLLLADT